MDTELKRRYDLIPNLIETVKGYASHEREVLERVTELREQAMASTGSPESQAADENMLVDALRNLFARAEDYPELKADDNFQQLQEELANTEDRIQAARRFYNANVREYNTRVRQFPAYLIAGRLGFEEREYFEIEEGERSLPEVDFGSGSEPAEA